MKKIIKQKFKNKSLGYCFTKKTNMSHSEEQQTDNNEEKIKKINKMIECREKQLSDMANMLADLNQQLNDVFLLIFPL